ncbi:uncharacterized protein LOC100937762 [Pongo abelii]|uniref:uncharacterized protein LOC100937762 n=1 Tax=Pongo abelii TaxID=9601 RepID=UPI0023E79303|nr:uncharacterized protein LOC100937762 isoform X2 [Pongo abelii]
MRSTCARALAVAPPPNPVGLCGMLFNRLSVPNSFSFFYCSWVYAHVGIEESSVVAMFSPQELTGEGMGQDPSLCKASVTVMFQVFLMTVCLYLTVLLTNNLLGSKGQHLLSKAQEEFEEN